MSFSNLNNYVLTESTEECNIFDSESENEFPSNFHLFPKLFPCFWTYKKVSFFSDEEKSDILHNEIEQNNFFKKTDDIAKKDTTHFNVMLKQKRGPKKKKISNKKIHKSDSQDNLLTKIKIHYLSFIVLFLNDVLSNLNYKQRFLHLSHKFKIKGGKKPKKEKSEKLTDMTIGEIISKEISDKYKHKNINYNKIIINKFKEDKVLNRILSENCLILFNKIYFKNEKKVNLKEYGLDKTIYLSNNVKMFKDLLLKNKGKNKNYERNMYICIKQNFIPELIFSVNYYNI